MASYMAPGASLPLRPVPALSTAEADSSTRPQPATYNQATAANLWKAAFEQLSLDNQTALRNLDSYGEVLQSLAKTVEQRVEEHASRRTKVTIAGHEYGLRDTANKVIKWIDKFKAVGDIASNADPMHFGLVWAGFRFLLQVASDHADALTNVLAGVENMSRHIARCSIYERLYLSCPSPNTALKSAASTSLSREIEALYASILKFLAQSIKKLDLKGALSRARRVFNPSNIPGLLQKCDLGMVHVENAARDYSQVRSKEDSDSSRLQVAGLQQHLKELRYPIVKVEQNVQQMFEIIEGQRRSNILQWISPNPHTAIHESTARSRAEGTCAWLINRPEYSEWRRLDVPAVLWLQGYPGVGKTKLTSAVIDDLLAEQARDPEAVAIAYFYCDRNQEDRRDAKKILGNLLRQLVTPWNDSQFPKSICDLYRKAESSGFASNGPSLNETLELLTQVFRLHPRLHVIVDALDECGEETRLKIIQNINQCIEKSSRPVKLFVSSRPEQDIEDYLRDAKNIPIKAAENQFDIDLFVTEKLKVPPIKWSAWFNESMFKEIHSALVRGGDGMFQWVSLQLDYLFRLSRKSDVSKRLALLRVLPKELKAAYDEIYKRIQDTEGSSPEIAARAFAWIMVSHEPLSPEMLLEAVCLDLESDTIEDVDIDIDFIRDACQHLIRFEKTSDLDTICRFSHLSVQEYLEDHHISPGEAHSLVANVCLSKLLGSDLSSSVSGYHYYVNIYDYITHCWPFHVKYAYSTKVAYDNQSLTEKLDDFFGISSQDYASYSRWAESLAPYASIEWSSGRTARDGISCSDILSSSGPNSPAWALIRLRLERLFEDWLRVNTVDTEARNCLDHTLLEAAAESGCFASVKLLVQKGARIDAQSTGLGTALHAACHRGDMDIVKFLLAKGASPHIIRGFYGSTLQAACYGASPEIVHLLLHYKSYLKLASADPNPQPACVNLDGRSGKSSLASDIDVNAVGGEYGTALHMACIEGREDLITILLSHGAAVNNISRQHQGTPLQLAVQCGNFECVRLLLEAKADPNLRGSESEGPLSQALNPQDDALCELLRLWGAKEDSELSKQ